MWLPLCDKLCTLLLNTVRSIRGCVVFHLYLQFCTYYTIIEGCELIEEIQYTTYIYSIFCIVITYGQLKVCKNDAHERATSSRPPLLPA